MAKKRFHGKHLGEELYAGSDSRKAQERQDFGMISEDKSAIANMPQQVIYKAYPKSRHYIDSGIGDTIDSIDRQIGKDTGKMEEFLQPEKY